MAYIVIIDLANGRYQVNLTDQHNVWAKRHFTSPAPALRYTQHLQEQGHRVAFPTALADLRDAIPPPVTPLRETGD